MEFSDEEGDLYPSVLDYVLAKELGEQEDYFVLDKEEEANLFNELFNETCELSERSEEVSNGTTPPNALAQKISEVEKFAMTGKDSMKCPLCNKIYRKQAVYYEQHLKNCSKKQSLINIQCKPIQLPICKICGHVKNNEESLKKHMYYCKKKPTVNCNYCSYTTKTIASLRSHIYHHHRDNKTTVNKEPKYVCAECGKHYTSRTSFRNHMQNCNNKAPDLHCSYCSFKSTSKWYLSRHLHDRHYIDGKFRREDCGWVRSLECPVCKKKYKYHSSLLRHQSVCGEEPKFQCSLCSFKCSKILYLELHKARQHPSDSSSN